MTKPHLAILGRDATDADIEDFVAGIKARAAAERSESELEDQADDVTEEPEVAQ